MITEPEETSSSPPIINNHSGDGSPHCDTQRLAMNCQNVSIHIKVAISCNYRESCSFDPDYDSHTGSQKASQQSPTTVLLKSTHSPGLLWVWWRRLVIYLTCFSFQKELEEFEKEGWEYAPIFTAKFHHKERKIDFVRRRRWHRRMVGKGGKDTKVSMPPVCLLEIDGEVRIT